jgi:hypothetical protein
VVTFDFQEIILDVHDAVQELDITHNIVKLTNNINLQQMRPHADIVSV